MTTYYLDATGNDSAAGTSPASAWRTLAKANATPLAPGDSLLLARGGVWEEATVLLTAAWAGTADLPITIGAYGSGPRPLIRKDAGVQPAGLKGIFIPGNYLVVRDLAFTVINPYRDPGCIAPDGVGVRFGFHVGVHITGHYITVQDCDLSHSAIGVNLTDSSHHVKVSGCYIHDLDTLWRYTAPGALGALGVNIHGTDHEICYNLLERNFAEGVRQSDGVYQSYAAPFECYNASRCVIHHNVAREHRKTCEFGRDAGAASSGNVFADNLITSSRVNAIGPNVHGADAFGPIYDTTIEHNTIVLTGGGSQALVVGGVGGAVVRDNILIAEWKAAYYNGVAPENNIYWDYQNFTDANPDPLVQGAQVPAEQKVDPLLDANYMPKGGSPALTMAADGGPVGARLQIGGSPLAISIADVQAQATAAAALATQLTAMQAQAAAVKAALDKIVLDLKAADAALDTAAGTIAP